ncbi:MAG: META domain-containing protein [Actinomycetota bacterium]|nr:META domain-containing protein [Actinomycetota bacterium]
MRRLLIALTVAGAALAAGCGEESDTARSGAGPGSGSLQGRTFVSRSVMERGQCRALVAGTEIRLTFHDDGRLIASAGCNTMSGPVATESERLVISDLATTEMGCDPARHAQDEWLAGVLTSRPTYSLESDRLTITTGDTVVELAG